MKSIRKFFAYALASVVLLVVVGLAAAYFLKDKIVSRFIEAANEQLSTPVKIGEIDVSLLTDFPSVSLKFSDVYIEDSHPEIYPLFTAKLVSFSFNSFDAWKGKYVVNGLKIEDSQTNLKINKAGKGNYRITKNSSGASKNVAIDLKNILLRRQRVVYLDESIRQSHEFTSSKLIADVSFKNDVYTINASGDVISNQIGIGENIFFKDKLFNLNLSMTYDDKERLITFKPSQVEEVNGEFDLSGTYQFKKENLLDLVVEGKRTNIQTILSFLPESIAKSVSAYESNGDLFFGLKVKGNLDRPAIAIDFGARNATIFHPETDFKITQANLTGQFNSIGVSNFSSASIRIKNMNGKLNRKPFTGQLYLQNFNKPIVDLKFKGELEAETVQSLLVKDYVNKASGSMIADVSLEGELSKLKSKKTAQQVKISGSIEMKNVSMSTRLNGINLEKLNGNFQFTNNDLAMSNVTGNLGRSDFRLNGFFRNIVSYLLFEGQPIGIEADLKSRFLDLDEMLILTFGEGVSDKYKFEISPNVYLNFNCDLNRLVYKKLNTEHVEGTLLVKNQKAYSRKITLSTMGGTVSMSGDISAAVTPIELNTTLKINGIHIDSLFYVFGNFRQDFIQDKHLKGQATATINVETKFNSDLTIVPESLVSHMDVQIKKGELNNFEPLQSLKKYLDDDGLKNLRFADLKNEIHIENQTILIPQMEVRSNVTVIQLSGRHHFDQRIDYRVVAPLRNKKLIDVEEAGEAFERDMLGKIKVYFKITGTTDNYKVAFDGEAVKKKLAKDLKNEVAELKDAFKDRDKKKKKELELTEDDYFDWDNNN